MPEPTISDIGERVYEEIAPVTVGDEERGWPLKVFVGGWLEPAAELDDIVSDDPETGAPGWSKVMDPDNAPAEWLPWLAQMLGIRLRPGASEAENRAAIKGLVGFRRGSPQAIRAVVEPLLTGTKYMIFSERYQGSAWRLGVFTLASETPDQAAVQRAILTQKPAGIVLTYQAITGNSYGAISGFYASYTAMIADPDYPNYAQLQVEQPD